MEKVFKLNLDISGYKFAMVMYEFQTKRRRDRALRKGSVFFITPKLLEISNVFLFVPDKDGISVFRTFFHNFKLSRL